MSKAAAQPKQQLVNNHVNVQKLDILQIKHSDQHIETIRQSYDCNDRTKEEMDNDLGGTDLHSLASLKDSSCESAQAEIAKALSQSPTNKTPAFGSKNGSVGGGSKSRGSRKFMIPLARGGELANLSSANNSSDPAHELSEKYRDMSLINMIMQRDFGSPAFSPVSPPGPDELEGGIQNQNSSKQNKNDFHPVEDAGYILYKITRNQYLLPPKMAKEQKELSNRIAINHYQRSCLEKQSTQIHKDRFAKTSYARARSSRRPVKQAQNPKVQNPDQNQAETKATSPLAKQRFKLMNTQRVGVAIGNCRNLYNMTEVAQEPKDLSQDMTCLSYRKKQIHQQNSKHSVSTQNDEDMMERPSFLHNRRATETDPQACEPFSPRYGHAKKPSQGVASGAHREPQSLKPNHCPEIQRKQCGLLKANFEIKNSCREPGPSNIHKILKNSQAKRNQGQFRQGQPPPGVNSARISPGPGNIYGSYPRRNIHQRLNQMQNKIQVSRHGENANNQDLEQVGLDNPNNPADSAGFRVSANPHPAGASKQQSKKAVEIQTSQMAALECSELPIIGPLAQPHELRMEDSEVQTATLFDEKANLKRPPNKEGTRVLMSRQNIGYLSRTGGTSSPLDPTLLQPTGVGARSEMGSLQGKSVFGRNPVKGDLRIQNSNRQIEERQISEQKSGEGSVQFKESLLDQNTLESVKKTTRKKVEVANKPLLSSYSEKQDTHNPTSKGKNPKSLMPSKVQISPRNQHFSPRINQGLCSPDSIASWKNTAGRRFAEQRGLTPTNDEQSNLKDSTNELTLNPPHQAATMNTNPSLALQSDESPRGQRQEQMDRTQSCRRSDTLEDSTLGDEQILKIQSLDKKNSYPDEIDEVREQEIQRSGRHRTPDLEHAQFMDFLQHQILQPKDINEEYDLYMGSSNPYIFLQKSNIQKKKKDKYQQLIFEQYNKNSLKKQKVLQPLRMNKQPKAENQAYASQNETEQEQMTFIQNVSIQLKKLMQQIDQYLKDSVG